MIRFQYLAHFPLDHFPYPAAYCLELFLCLFAYFADYEIDRFISITTQSMSALLLRLIYICFNIVGRMVLIYAAIRRDSVSLSSFPFLIHVMSFRVRFPLFVAWNIHTDGFLLISYFLFSLFCWSLYCLGCFRSL